ncbi:hypothetical protein F4677DRAFT_41247 [Hypoxylon crocopeplum]|nr:hypothetical protein F4677DRAFT_41247 [Hypoxylon crocopeplum]
MSDNSSSVSSLTEEPIRVYHTTDGTIEHWTNPRRIHLHKKTTAGLTVCCESITAGGVIEDPDGELFYLTSDQLTLPARGQSAELYQDTFDKGCVCVGHVKHTNTDLHYALVTVDGIASEDSRKIAKYYHMTASGRNSFKVALHPVVLKYQHTKSDLLVMARTRHDEIIRGRITSLPKKTMIPASLGRSEQMVARFSSAHPLEKIEAGMWVYARREGVGVGKSREAVDTDGKLNRLDPGPYPSGTFRYVPPGNATPVVPNPLVLIGHIVEVRGGGRMDPDAPVEAVVQSAYEVLAELFVQRGRLNYPSIGRPIPPDVLSVNTDVFYAMHAMNN